MVERQRVILPCKPLNVKSLIFSENLPLLVLHTYRCLKLNFVFNVTVPTYVDPPTIVIKPSSILKTASNKYQNKLLPSAAKHQNGPHDAVIFCSRFLYFLTLIWTYLNGIWTIYSSWVLKYKSKGDNLILTNATLQKTLVQLSR